MIKDEIIETTGKKVNKNLSVWYQSKVLELADLLLRKVEKESIQVKSNRSFEPYELEVITK